jgi:hypothetical protein
MQERLIDYVAANRKLKDKLLFESKFVGRENEKDIAEGDDYQSMQEVRVEAVSREISTTVFAAEVEARKDGKGNQQFSDERIKCSRMLWKSNEDQISLQQKNELEKVIAELWNLMQMPKESYNKIKQVIYCRNDCKVKNRESEGSGALQYKVWKPRRLQLEEG